MSVHLLQPDSAAQALAALTASPADLAARATAMGLRSRRSRRRPATGHLAAVPKGRRGPPVSLTPRMQRLLSRRHRWPLCQPIRGVQAITTAATAGAGVSTNCSQHRWILPTTVASATGRGSAARKGRPRMARARLRPGAGAPGRVADSRTARALVAGSCWRHHRAVTDRAVLRWLLGLAGQAQRCASTPHSAT